MEKSQEDHCYSKYRSPGSKFGYVITQEIQLAEKLVAQGFVTFGDVKIHIKRHKEDPTASDFSQRKNLRALLKANDSDASKEPSKGDPSPKAVPLSPVQKTQGSGRMFHESTQQNNGPDQTKPEITKNSQVITRVDTGNSILALNILQFDFGRTSELGKPEYLSEGILSKVCQNHLTQNLFRQKIQARRGVCYAYSLY